MPSSYLKIRPVRRLPGQAPANGERDLILATQRFFDPPYPGRDGGQLFLGGIEQFAALARPFLGEQRITADHEALARIVGRGDLGEVTLIIQIREVKPPLFRPG
jgi:hypothetical protein